MKKNKRTYEETTDNKTYKMARRFKELKCTICPPNKGCNNNSFKKHGAQKFKKKNINRESIRESI